MKKPLFIHIPKTGGTSYRRSLQSAGIRVYPLIGDTHHGYYKDILKENPAFASDDYQPFTIVRNPWDRMVSIYHYYSQNTEELTPTSKEFRDFPLEFLNDKRRWGWAHITQSEWMKDVSGKNNVFVARFENLIHDFKTLVNIIGANKNIELSHYRPNKRNIDYKFYYDENAKQIVQDLFQEDINNFGYTYA